MDQFYFLFNWNLIRWLLRSMFTKHEIELPVFENSIDTWFMAHQIFHVYFLFTTKINSNRFLFILDSHCNWLIAHSFNIEWITIGSSSYHFVRQFDEVSTKIKRRQKHVNRCSLFKIYNLCCLVTKILMEKLQDLKQNKTKSDSDFK